MAVLAARPHHASSSSSPSKRQSHCQRAEKRKHQRTAPCYPLRWKHSERARFDSSVAECVLVPMLCYPAAEFRIFVCYQKQELVLIGN